jgi:hypothetical protein
MDESVSSNSLTNKENFPSYLYIVAILVRFEKKGALQLIAATF